MTTVDWLIVLILNGGVIAYGIYLARGIKTSSEWFLGKRALVWWVIGLSMMATNIDNADLVSLTGKTYLEGIHIITVHTLGTAIGAVLAAFFIVPAMYRSGCYTNAEYLETRYGPSMRVLSALIQIQYRTSMLGLMIWSVHLLLTGLVGLPSGQAWALIVLLVVLSAVYTAWGGLRSVAMTDACQGVIMLVATAVIFCAVWNAAGGWSSMLETLRTASDSEGVPAADLLHVGRFHGASGTVPSIVIVLFWVIVAGGYWTVNHTQTMRLLGARSVWDMKMGAVFGAALSVPIMIGCTLLGVFARALYPDFADPDQIYPLMANEYLGVGLKGLVVAGILAAAISTFDSMGAALSAVFTRDIYARLIRPDKDDQHYLRVGRWATVGILVLGFAYIPFIQSKKTMLDAFLTLIPVFVTPLFTLYLAGVFTRAHARSGVIGLAVGAIYGLAALFDREVLDVAWLAPWFTGGMVAVIWSMFFTGAAMAVSTFCLGKCQENQLSKSGSGGWLARSREELPEMLERPDERAAPRWAKPEWFAAALILFNVYLVFGLFW
jgi:SSS family solute:Na+ symporter